MGPQQGAGAMAAQISWSLNEMNGLTSFLNIFVNNCFRNI